METRALTDETDVLLLPFLRAEGESERERLLGLLVEEHAAPVVRGVVKSKLRVSLKPSDGREENQDAPALPAHAPRRLRALGGGRARAPLRPRSVGRAR